MQEKPGEQAATPLAAVCYYQSTVFPASMIPRTKFGICISLNDSSKGANRFAAYFQQFKKFSQAAN
jgi:hypothetical protein